MRLLVNGLGLKVEARGAGPPLLLLHGFTGSGATWQPLAEALADRARTIAVDLIGHGGSDAPDEAERYGMRPAVADLRALLDRLGLERTDLLGYSLGGRLALQVAAAAPDRLRRLVLESASPGLERAAEREQRRAGDEALAARIEREGLEAFVDSWERIPLFASQASLPPEVRRRQRAQRLRQRPSGLANSLRGMGTGAQPSLWGRLGTLTVPTLLVVGALDHKFLAIGREMAARLPNARLAIVPDAGHAVHLEQPAAFARLVAEFLEAETMGDRR